MKFLSTFEMAEKWGISPRQILNLIKNGRVPEAKFVSSRWMLPENLPKPADGRTKTARTEKNKKGTDTFRYPIFEFKDVSSFYPPLSREELTLKTVVEAVNACRFDDAKVLLGELPKKTQCKYIRITALYCGCMIHYYLNDLTLFLDCYGKLKAEFQEDFPHKEEMSEYIHELDSVLGLNEYYSDGFRYKPDYCYHESFLPRLCNLSALWLAFSNKKISFTDLATHEINCSFLEKTDNPFDLQAVHTYLACVYGIINQKTASLRHFHRALELAQKYDMFYTIAVMQYYYVPDILNEALQDFPQAFKNKITECNLYVNKAHIRFTNVLKINSIYKLLADNDYLYIIFAEQNLTNKEIAGRMHTSVGTVGKRYSDIYSTLGVNSKKEMLELYHKLAKNAEKKKVEGQGLP